MIAVVDPHKITDCIVIGIATCRSPWVNIADNAKNKNFLINPFLYITVTLKPATLVKKKFIYLIFCKI